MKIKITNSEPCGLGSACIRVASGEQDVIIGAGDAKEIEVADDEAFAGVVFRMSVRKKFDPNTGDRLPDVNELPPDVPQVHIG